MPISLTGRLLCAAKHAYMITATGITPPSPSGPTDPSPPPSTLVGYLSDPPCYAVGDDKINAGLVGETATEIIVAFRGTEPFDSPDRGQMVLDWLDDADAPLIPNPVFPAPTGMPGQVHQGFFDALNELWPLMWPQIQNRLAASPGKPVYITGHSKGGAIAPLAAMLCQAAGLAPYVCTFAAARCGDQTFANGYDAAVTHSVRYEFQDDIVPHLPPSDAFLATLKNIPFLAGALTGLTQGYVSVGTLYFINWQNQVVSDSPLLDLNRLTHLADLLLTLGAGTIINDHSVDPGGGYANAVCPGVWPPAPAP